MKTKRLFLMLAALVTLVLECHAVLKEKDLGNTLSILRNELTEVHLEQERHTAQFKEQSETIRRNIFDILQKSNQNSLMLYSQKIDYVFDLTYACHEATNQFHDFKKNSTPFRTYMSRIDSEIARYDSLVTSLQTMPLMSLDEQGAVDRNVCLTLAVNIRNTMQANKETLGEYISMYDMTEQHLKNLNDYANKRYSDIQNRIFNNSADNYFTVLASLDEYVATAASTMSDKYRKTSNHKSQWDIRMIIGLFVVIIFYGIIAIVINIVAIRLVLPRIINRIPKKGKLNPANKISMDSKEFIEKRSCVILTTTVVTFALILGIIKATVEQNFILMASNLLVEYAWLLGVILISLLLRLESRQIRCAYRIYAPLIFVGFLVISFRIVLIPNDLVNLVFPPVLLLCSFWQWLVISRNGKRVPSNDMLYAYISLIIFIASTVCAWIGYTLLSVQILIWWIMQLTCILTITCLVGWMKKYSDKHNIYERPINETWFFRFVYRVVMPVMGLMSIMISIYWAADVFNLSDLTWRIFTMKFVDSENFSLSIASIIIVASLYFLFGYINRVSLDILKQRMSRGDVKNAASRTVMGKNVIQAVVWVAWLMVSLSIMHVSTTWLVVISGGLSTGIGFASKDILENIYYGISLMAGRIKVGDWIECDGIKGKVSSISYTSTLLEAVDGSVIAFTNSQLFTKNYKNLTRNHGYVLATVPFGVAYGNDAKNVVNIVTEAVKNMHHKLIDNRKGVTILFSELGDNSINFKLLCWVDVIKQGIVMSDVMECIYRTLNEHNIEIPFPQQDVYIKSMPKEVEN